MHSNRSVRTRWAVRLWRARRGLARVHRDQAGATILEWTLLLAAIVLPSYFIIRIALFALIAHYRMIVTINALPFP